MLKQKAASRSKTNRSGISTPEALVMALFGAVLPGVFLGALFSWTLAELGRAPGLIGVPGVAIAVAALEGVVGAALAGFWRERVSLRGMLFFPFLLLCCCGVWPDPMMLLVVCGILAGGYFTALPVSSGALRLFFGVSFALAAFLLPGAPWWSLLLRAALFPLLLAGAVLWVKARWWFRVGMIILLPVATIGFTAGLLANRPVAARANPGSIAPALPAALMANCDTARILFLSDRPSLLPGMWCALPFISGVECIWPQAERLDGGVWEKLSLHAGMPGRVVPGLPGDYHLIYVEAFPAGAEAARRDFVGKLWKQLKEKSGILILPAECRSLLPPKVYTASVPGSAGRLIAASDSPVSNDVELLDRRLQEYQKVMGDEAMFMPAGVFAALYGGESRREIPSVSGDGKLLGGTSSPQGFYAALGLLLAGYGAIRLFFGRLGRNLYGFNLWENSAGFALLLLAAYGALSARELFTGVPSGIIWGCAGLSCIFLPLRRRAELAIAWAAIALPWVWLLPWSAAECEPSWLLVVGFAALASGILRRRIAAESEFPRSWRTTFSAAGWAAGAGIYAVFYLLLEDPLLPSLITASVLHLAWPLKL